MGQSFIDFILSNLENVETEQIAAWMRNGELNTGQYRAMQVELLRRKKVIDKRRKRVPR